MRIIPAKEKDIAARTHFLRIFIKLFVAFALPFMLIGGLWLGLVIDTAVSLVLTVIAVLFLDRLSGIPAALFGLRKPIISIREQTAGTLKAVKVLKMNKDYKKALDMVNSILEKDPDFYEAMVVKAQILSEGFENREGAKKYLKIVMENTDKTENLHSWAVSLSDQINSDCGESKSESTIVET